jgi:F-type H+-transporting ATPase subunit a
MKRALAAVTLVALLAPASALARGDFDPTEEFEQHEWIPIHLGPIDMSITKAVAYLMLGSVLTILFGLFFMRSKAARVPGRRETIGELAYEVAQTQIAEPM